MAGKVLNEIRWTKKTRGGNRPLTDADVRDIYDESFERRVTQKIVPMNVTKATLLNVSEDNN